MSNSRASAASGTRIPNLIFLLLSWFLIHSLALPCAFAQEEAPKGSIEGTVIDAVGAPVSGATVFVNSRTAEVPLSLTTDKDGKYSTGPLNAGTYTVQVEARNFRSNRFFVNVRNGQTSNGDRKLVRIEPWTPTISKKVDPES